MVSPASIFGGKDGLVEVGGEWDWGTGTGK